METFRALLKGEANRSRPLMVFDWDKAAQLIAERRPSVARAGLCSDWEYTGGDIYRGGKPVRKDDTYTYLASTWATPELDLDGDVIPCFRMKTDAPGWGSDTYWPESALGILSPSTEQTPSA